MSVDEATKPAARDSWFRPPRPCSWSNSEHIGGRALFASPPGAQSHVLLQLDASHGLSEAHLTAQVATLATRQTCAGTGATTLRTVIVVSDGVDPPITFALVAPWQCVLNADASMGTLQRQASGTQPGET